MPITLDKEHGLNPHQTYCPNCGGEARELLLIGNKTEIVKCRGCGLTVYGGKPLDGKCPGCKQHTSWDVTGRVQEGDRLPSPDICPDCKEEAAKFLAVIEAGGIYWRCHENHRHCGVIESHAPICEAVRKEQGVPTGPVGIELSKDQCPVCRKQE